MLGPSSRQWSWQCTALIISFFIFLLFVKHLKLYQSWDASLECQDKPKVIQKDTPSLHKRLAINNTNAQYSQW